VNPVEVSDDPSQFAPADVVLVAVKAWHAKRRGTRSAAQSCTTKPAQWSASRRKSVYLSPQTSNLQRNKQEAGRRGVFWGSFAIRRPTLNPPRLPVILKSSATLAL
jgi:hypothetical protein